MKKKTTITNIKYNRKHKKEMKQFYFLSEKCVKNKKKKLETKKLQKLYKE